MKLKNKGFSLVELMVVVAIMGIVSVGIFSLIGQVLKSSNYSEDRLSKVLFTQSAHTIMSGFAACQNTYRGVNPGAVGSTQTLPDIKNVDGDVVYSSGDSDNTFENLTIQQIDLINRDITPGAVAGRVSLVFHLARNRTGGGTGRFMTDPIDTRVLMNTATNEISGCSSGGVAGGLTQVLTFYEGPATTISGFNETEVMTFSLNRLPAPSEIHIGANLGGVDVVWATYRLYRGSLKIAEWTDGTSHELGASIRTNYIKYRRELIEGPQSYRLTVQRLSHPSYGTLPMHTQWIDVIFKQ